MTKLYFSDNKITSDSILHEENNKYYNLKNLLTIKKGELIITKTSGNSTATGTYAKYGKILAINVHLETTGTTNSGSNIFVGKITNFTPAINGMLVGYLGGRAIIGAFGTDNVLTIRNASSQSANSGASINIRGTFIVN